MRCRKLILGLILISILALFAVGCTEDVKPPAAAAKPSVAAAPAPPAAPVQDNTEQINWRVMQLTILMGALLIFVFYMMYLRGKYAKEVIGKVYTLFTTKEGNNYWELLPVEAGTITLYPKKIKGQKDLKPGRTYAVADIATSQMDYPLGRPKFLQSKAKFVHFDADSWEPISNRSGQLILSPIRLFNLLHEMFSSRAITIQRDDSENRQVAAKATNNTTIWVIIIVLMIAVAVLGFFLMKYMNIAKAAAGIP